MIKTIVPKYLGKYRIYLIVKELERFRIQYTQDWENLIQITVQFDRPSLQRCLE